MSRHLSTDATQLYLRSSPSQQHLNPSRSSSLPSQQGDELAQQTNERPHKLDLYSIPVFLLEVLVLLGLAYLAYFVHFQYHHEPLISGFYCDDISYRQQYVETSFTQQFSQKQNELTIVALLLAVPIVLIIFCELVNSMFGSLKFRQIRAICTCCKLHSITRRSIRFSGAYALGFLIVVISCDILATCAGRLRPHFAQDCPYAYRPCVAFQSQPTRDQSNSVASTVINSTYSNVPVNTSDIVPASPPISANISPPALVQPAALMPQGRNLNDDSRFRQVIPVIVERHWIDLTGQNLSEICHFNEESIDARYKFNQIAMSWPSFPAAIFTYACLFISCYLCFVGTARPFRIITSVLVMTLLLLVTVFNVQLVKEHYSHWDDVAASAFLAFVVVIFVLIVYLNRFKDTHYYENQKLFKRKFLINGNFKGGYSGDALANHYSSNKNNGGGAHTNDTLQDGETSGPISNNDLAMRYFQIPRANYRGAPISSLNQML